MDKHIKVLLFKDSSCELCKMVHKELIDNPPNADLEIIHIKHEHNNQLVNYYSVTKFPTIIIIENNTNDEINRFEGFISSKDIDINIENYETKSLV